MVQFNQVRRGEYLPDIIVSEIMSQISEGALKPGDTIPTKTMLAESFGVSRNVVREAMARLRSDRVIQTMQGRGACVLLASERATFRVDPLHLVDKEQLAQLFELRGLLEIDAAGIAALRREDAELAQMETAIESMTGQAEFDERRLEADASFHRALGAATKNEFLATIVDYLSGRLKETTKATDEIYAKSDLLDITMAEHCAILDAVREGEAAASRAAMSRHIKGAAERLDVSVPKLT